jgi:hypothetical protein
MYYAKLTITERGVGTRIQKYKLYGLCGPYGELYNLIRNMSKHYTKIHHSPFHHGNWDIYVILAHQVFGNNFSRVGKVCCCLPLIFLLPRCFAAMSSEPRPRYWCSASRVTRCSLHTKNITRLHDPDSTYHPDADPDPTFHPDADPDSDPSFQIKAQNPGKSAQ